MERDRTLQSSMLLNDLGERGDGEEREFVDQNKVIWNKKSTSGQERVVEESPDTKCLVN